MHGRRSVVGRPRVAGRRPHVADRRPHVADRDHRKHRGAADRDSPIRALPRICRGACRESRGKRGGTDAALPASRRTAATRSSSPSCCVPGCTGRYRRLLARGKTDRSKTEVGQRRKARALPNSRSEYALPPDEEQLPVPLGGTQRQRRVSRVPFSITRSSTSPLRPVESVTL